MRLPTFAGLTSATQGVVARFPEVAVVALAAATFGLFTAHQVAVVPADWPAWWAAATLGIPGFLAVAVAAERWRPAGASRFTVPRLVGSLLMAGFVVGFALSWMTWTESVRMHRLLQWALPLHLLVSFTPFLGRNEPNAFWQFNRILFVRFLTGVLFCGVLFVGLAIALASAKPLFGVRVPERAYFDLWITIAFVFNTAYLLAGVPEDPGLLERDETYPTGLKVFAQFILVPLVAVYLAILTAYLVKVLVTGQWPKGWIGWLVSSVSAAGLLSLLLVHPVRDRAENRWVGTYARWFYIALLPSVAMLFAAIGKRVGQYGFTEERFFLLVLACWIAAIALFYTFRRVADIRWIPVTLCALALVTSFGPWGASGVSRADQTGRLIRAMRKHGVLTDQGLAIGLPLGHAERQELSAGIDYLGRTYGPRGLPPVLRDLAPPDSMQRDHYRYSVFVAEEVMKKLGLAYVPSWQSVESHHFQLFADRGAPEVQSIAGFDHVVSFGGLLPTSFEVDGRSVWVRIDPRRRSLVVTSPPGAAWEIPLDSLVRELSFESGYRSRTAVRLEGIGSLPSRLVIQQLNGTDQGDTLSDVSMTADLYLSWGKQERASSRSPR